MATQWYYVESGQQAGPISSAELKALVASGQLGPSDLVWKEGLEDWVAAEKVKGLFQMPPVPNAETSPDDLDNDFGERELDTTYDPPRARTQKRKGKGIQFDRLNDAFTTVTKKPGSWLGISFVFLAANAGIGVLNQWGTVAATVAAQGNKLVVGVTTFLLFLLLLAIQLILIAGMYRVCLEAISQRPFGVKLLSSTTKMVVPLFLANVIVILLAIAALIPGGIMVGVGLAFASEQNNPAIGLFFLFSGGLLAFLSALYVGARLLFVIPFLVQADGRIKATEAVRLSWSATHNQVVKAAIFNFLAGLLSALGILLCGVGFLITLPVYYVAIAMAFVDSTGKSQV